MFGSIVPYLNSEWSFAQFRIEEKTPNKVIFGNEPQNTLIVITLTGNYYLATFD